MSFSVSQDPGSSPGAPTTSSFTTQAQAAFRRASGQRVLWACLVAVLLVVIGLLLSPRYDPREDVLANYGAPGELVIMPEISIKEGQDRQHQLPKSLQIPPPPARMEVEKEELSPEGTVAVPEPTEAPPNENITPVKAFNPDAEVATKNLVELNMPRQSNPDLYILHQVHPEYPLTVSEEERRTPVIYVLVAVFVNPDGDVTEAMIMTNTGSPAYADEVIEKVKQWKFGWRVAPGAGRWIQLPYNFNSPYFTGGQD